MKKLVMMVVVVGVMIGNVSAWAEDYSFGEWALDTGLSANATQAAAQLAGITNLDGLANYTQLQEVYLSDNPITSLEAKDFIGLSNLTDLQLSRTDISSIETGVFSGKQNLYRFYLNDQIPIQTLNFSGAQFQDLTFFNVKQVNLNVVNLTNSELSQWAFNHMMDGGGFVGLDGAPIIEMNFSSANLSDVTEFDHMFPMDFLETLNIANVDYADVIYDNNYNEILDLINALESRSLNYLTIDSALYNIQQSYFDTWDSLPLNYLTVIPEPSTLFLIGLGGLFLRKRK